MTDLLKFRQCLWLDTILLKVVLRCDANVLNDLLEDLALHADISPDSRCVAARHIGLLAKDRKNITDSNNVRHDGLSLCSVLKEKSPFVKGNGIEKRELPLCSQVKSSK